MLPVHRAPLPLISWPVKAWYAIGCNNKLSTPFSVEHKTFIIVAALQFFFKAILRSWSKLYRTILFF